MFKKLYQYDYGSCDMLEGYVFPHVDDFEGKLYSNYAESDIHLEHPK